MIKTDALIHMSFSAQEARAFLAPLTGRTTTFLLESREANLGFARTLMDLLASGGSTCAVVDLDAFYSSNSDRIFQSLNSPAARGTTIRVPEPGADPEGELSLLFEVDKNVIVIDSLNTLNHLISQDDGSTRSRKLAFAVASLSYFARTNGKAILLSMYNRDGFIRKGTSRSISSLAEGTVTVESGVKELVLRSERGSVRPGGASPYPKPFRIAMSMPVKTDTTNSSSANPR